MSSKVPHSLILLGTFRSGASAVAGTLERMGVGLGHAEDLVKRDGEQEPPCWERRDVRALCQGVLHELLEDNENLPLLRSAVLPSASRDRWQRRLAAIQEALKPFRPWLIKDARMCSLMAWIRPWLEAPLVVHVVRHPMETALALRASQGLPVALGLALWELHNKEALRASAGLPRLLVRYEELLAEPQVVCARLRAELAGLGLDGLRLPAEQELRELLRPSLRHIELAPEEADRGLSADLQSFWHSLRERSLPEDPGELSQVAWNTFADHEQARTRHKEDLLEVRERLRLALAGATRPAPDDRERLRLQHELDVVTQNLEQARARASELEQRLKTAETAHAQAADTAQRLAPLEQRANQLRQELHNVLWSRPYRLGTGLTTAWERFVPGVAKRLIRWVFRRLRPLYKKFRGNYEPAVSASLKKLVITPQAGARKQPAGQPSAAPVRAIFPHPAFGTKLHAPVTVIVPIFNAFEDLRCCVDALERNLSYPAELLLIDDKSSDERIGEYLDGLRGRCAIRILRNEKNLGYTATVNRGISACEGDVVLLNSDTEIGPRWLENLILAAYSRERIATVTALSDNAGAFSVPQVNAKNALPEGLAWDEVARAVMQDATRILPETPTGSGFCLYMRRAAIAEVGPFDEQRFPRGYGEENDYCLRASERGWQHLIDDRTLVRHSRSKSFGKEKETLIAAGKAALAQRYPQYSELVRAFLGSKALHQVQAQVRTTFQRISPLSAKPRPRLLYVIHEGSGGTAKTNRDLMLEVGREYECFLLSSNGRALNLSQIDRSGLRPVESVRLHQALGVATLTSQEYCENVRRMLVQHGIELVHIRHLFGHTLDLPEIARGLNIPVAISFHDYYFVCPTINLLDEKDHYCAGRCTEGDGACRLPTRWAEGVPPLKHRWVYEWRTQVRRRVLAQVDACICTTAAAKEVYAEAYPEFARQRVEIIEHGRDLEQHALAVAPRPDAPMRVLLLGNLTAVKGGDFVRALHELDRERRLEFHVLGACHAEYQGLAVQHGTYEQEELAAKIRAIGPSVAGLFSIWAETYSHTLTEAWSVGLPVVATDLGAFRERILENGGGCLVPPHDPRVAYELLLRLRADPNLWQEVAAKARIVHPRSVRAMGDDYLDLYSSLRRERSTLKSVTATLVPAP